MAAHRGPAAARVNAGTRVADQTVVAIKRHYASNDPAAGVRVDAIVRGQLCALAEATGAMVPSHDGTPELEPLCPSISIAPGPGSLGWFAEADLEALRTELLDGLLQITGLTPIDVRLRLEEHLTNPVSSPLSSFLCALANVMLQSDGSRC